MLLPGVASAPTKMRGEERAMAKLAALEARLLAREGVSLRGVAASRTR